MAAVSRLQYPLMCQVLRQIKGRVRILDWGLADYRKILVQQKGLHEQRRAGTIFDTILMGEHPPVVTLGARKSANRFVTTPGHLIQKGIDVVEIRRGGGVTAHNPGQLVFYPIIHLGPLQLTPGGFVHRLEQAGRDLLRTMGIEAYARKEFPGLWVDDRKIASVGVRVSRQVTLHGMAINIQNDLSIFAYFIPCGLDHVVMTSAQQETGRIFDMAHLKQTLADIMIQAFY